MRDFKGRSNLTPDLVPDLFYPSCQMFANQYV